MKYRSRDTIASLMDVPQAKAISVVKVDTTAIAARVRTYRHNCDKRNPDTEAMTFYVLNQCVALIAKDVGLNGKLSPEQKAIVAWYVRELVDQTERLFGYMTLITTRESRHVHSAPSFYDPFKAKFGQANHDFLVSIRGVGSDSAVDKFTSDPPKGEFGLYVEGLCHTFYQGKFGGGYGGKPWGNIADCLRRAVQGETSMEVMCDTAYTLAHNNGPMFNKGMMYTNYSNKLYRILDVQRSGQCVELALDEGGVSVELKKVCQTIRSMYPKEVGMYVDWFKVQQLGALKDYTAEQKKQTELYGKKTDVPEGMKIVGKIEIFPSLSVNLLKRMKKAA